jgi:hypothetical protein
MRRGREASDAFDAGELIANSELPFLDLLDEIHRVQATIEIETLAIIEETASKGNWRAAAWLLERTHPERWGPPHRRLPPVEPPRRVDVAELERKVMAVLGNRGEIPNSP